MDDGSGATAAIKITRIPPLDELSEVDQPSNTIVSNVNILTAPGLLAVEIDGTQIDIGTVIEARCTVTTYRGTKQLDLKRVKILRSTKGEANAWLEISKWKKIISVPWTLTKPALRRLDKEHHAELKKDKQDMIRYEQNLQQHQRRKKLREADAEVERQKEEQVMNQGALI